MAIADITARLYSLQSFRTASLTKIVTESVRQNIAYRFTVLGMLGTLLRSRSLLSVAEGRYAAKVDVKVEKRQQSEEQQFKSYTVGAIKTLGNQITLLTAATEKNIAIINMLVNDLGYFKGQRRMNYLTTAGSIRSVRVPFPSRTVKGKIDLINQEIQNIKMMSFDKEVVKDKRITEAKARRTKEKENQKRAIAAGVAAALGILGLTTGGIGGAALAGAGALTAAVGLAGAAATQKAVELAVQRAVPILGTALKATLAVDILSGTLSRTGRRLTGATGVQIGDAEDYTNNEMPGTAAYRRREEEIRIKQELNSALEQPLSLIDKAILGYGLYWAVTRGARGYQMARSPAARRLLSRIPGARRFFPSVTPSAARAPTSIGGMSPAAAAAGGRVVGGRVWTGKMWKTLPSAAASGTPLGAAPRATRVKRYLPISAIKGITKLNLLIRNNRFMGFAKVGGLAAAFIVPTIIDMTEAANQYQNGRINYGEYKDRTVRGYKMLVDTVGVTGISAALGTLVGGPVGFFAGAGAGVAASFFMEDSTTWAAEKLFSLLHGQAIAEASADSTTSVDTAAVAARTQAPSAVSKVVSEDSKFMQEVNRVSEKFDIDPADLLAVMYRESLLDPAAVNSSSGATGLIQFMPKTAESLGTTTSALRGMTRSEQMKFIEAYFDQVGLPQGADRGTIYSYVFLPGFAKQGRSILAAANDPETSKYYRANEGLDIVPPFGMITIDDLSASTSKDGPMLARMAKDQRSMVASFAGGVNRETSAQIMQILSETLPEPAKRAMAFSPDATDDGMQLVSKINEMEERIKVTESALEISTQRLAGQLYNQGKSQLETRRLIDAKSGSVVSTENTNVSEYYA